MKRVMIFLALIIRISCLQAQDYFILSKRSDIEDFVRSWRNGQSKTSWAIAHQAYRLTAKELYYSPHQYLLVYNHKGGYLIFPSSFDQIANDTLYLRAHVLADPTYGRLYLKKEVEVGYWFTMPDKPFRMGDIHLGKCIVCVEPQVISDFESLIKKAAAKNSVNSMGAAVDIRKAMDFAISNIAAGDPGIGRQIQAIRDRIAKQIKGDGTKISDADAYRMGKYLLTDSEKMGMAAGEGKSPDGNAVQGTLNGLDGIDNGLSESGNGLKGPFPIRVPFPKWAGMVVKYVAMYLGIEQLGAKALALAYMIAPELFDYIGSFIANAIHAVVPATLEKFWNTMAGVLEHLEKYLQYAKMVYDMVKGVDFQHLLKNIDLKKLDVSKIVDVAEKIKLIPQKYLDAARDFLPLLDFNHLNMDKLQKVVKSNALKYGSRYLDKEMQKHGLPVSFSGLSDCIQAQTSNTTSCARSFLRESAENLIIQKTPGLKNYPAATRLLLDGKFEQAATTLATSTVAKALKVPASDIEEMLTCLKHSDYRGFISKAAKTGVNRARVCPGYSPEIIKDIEEGKIEDLTLMQDVTACILQLAGESAAASRVTNAASTLRQWAVSVKESGGVAAWIDREKSQLRNQQRSQLEHSTDFTQQQINDFLNGRSSDAMNEHFKNIFVDKLHISPEEAQYMLTTGNLFSTLHTETGEAVTSQSAKTDSNNRWLEYLWGLFKNQQVFAY